MCRFIYRRNGVDLNLLNRGRFLTKIYKKMFIKLTNITGLMVYSHCIGQWPGHETRNRTRSDAKMFTLVRDRDINQEPLLPTVPVPFHIQPPVPVQCSVKKPLVGKIVVSIKMHNNSIIPNNITIALPLIEIETDYWLLQILRKFHK